eukprot:Plantae.Rhodophyta-Purpureofilum_apyrenoidigerum.ctg15638.p2 GENE.Plantae.Rhodophyta-Purpureofilum_apyrenoidigerum.ctg15638~~Plantae.Rhodophyta-Purpureofilum_apyrenoidigerum.ctg15638.p2  ORF type:complete len:142 (+),score=42.66 Plantae.Rhodophyta-Purpureofilum_apyrenoidigerum.ctg15638:57-428(+)
MTEAVAPQEVTEEQRQVLQKYASLKQDLQELYSKIAEIDADKSEHELVLSQLNGLSGDRRCWQQIGEVLTETNVESVVPILDSKKKNIEEAMSRLSAEVQRKEAALADLQKTYNIQEKNSQAT